MSKLKLVQVSQFNESDIHLVVGISNGSNVSFNKIDQLHWELSDLNTNLSEIRLLGINNNILAYTPIDIDQNYVTNINISIELNIIENLYQGYGINIDYTYRDHVENPFTPVPSNDSLIGTHLSQGLLADNLTNIMSTLDGTVAQFTINESDSNASYNEFNLASNDITKSKDLTGISSQTNFIRRLRSLSYSAFSSVRQASGSPISDQSYDDGWKKLFISSDEIHGLFKYFIVSTQSINDLVIFDKSGIHVYRFNNKLDSSIYRMEILRIFDNLIITSGNKVILYRDNVNNTSNTYAGVSVTFHTSESELVLQNYSLSSCSDFGHFLINHNDMSIRNPFDFNNGSPSEITNIETWTKNDSPYGFVSNLPPNFYFDFLTTNKDLVRSQIVSVYNAMKFISENEYLTDVDKIHFFDCIATYIHDGLIDWISYSDYNQIKDYSDSNSKGMIKKYGRIKLELEYYQNTFDESDLVRIDCENNTLLLYYFNSSKGGIIREFNLTLGIGNIETTSYHSTMDSLFSNDLHYRGITSDRD